MLQSGNTLLAEQHLPLVEECSVEASGKLSRYELWKRAFDVVVAISLIVCLIPIFIGITVAIYLSSCGPIIYKQKRLTQGGKVFTMFKFRTMRIDAEEQCGAVWAKLRDPRTTTVGRFLRAFRLDELPQLVNVIKGEMSLIGPRPERPEIAERLSKQLPSFNKRLDVKAGITGLAQVQSGYASCISSYRQKLAWDLVYINNKSIKLDLQIALQTLFVVLTGNGGR